MKAGFFYVALISLVTCARSAHAQGTVIFANFYTSSPNAPVYESDGVTKCSGSQFMSELLAGPSANNLASIATAGLLTGGLAGYFNAGDQAINSVLPGTTAFINVRVWNTSSGNSFLQAQASGLPDSWWQSSIFTVTTGGGFQGLTPAPLTGLGNSPVYLNSVPEPATPALLGLGCAVLFIRNRRLN